MTEYEIIDALCDSVNPILFFIAIGVGIENLVKKKFKNTAIVFGLLLVGLLLVYGMLFVDIKLKIWEFFGSDYSTHTAFAIATCIAISTGKPWFKWLFMVLLVYVIAMLYQDYHSAWDIVLTSVVIGGPLLLIRKYLC